MKIDKCIKSFRSDIIAVYLASGEIIKGRLDVENTGVELIFDLPLDNTRRSHILYKDEYDQIRFFVRFHSDLDARRHKKRMTVMKKTYHPNILRRILRSIGIFFKIIRDSLMDIFMAFSGRMKTANPAYASNEAYLAKANREAVSSVDTAHNPILEKYIGNKVVCSHTFNGRQYDVRGILKDYSGFYLELLDAEFIAEDIAISAADLVLPRSQNKVRGLGEETFRVAVLKKDFRLNLYKKRIKKSSHDRIAQ
ncbi:MAG: hypothetical protein JXB33_01420 [Clostridia bacterium]|nr:hypothetical protein [Clostridia bacterium]